jgi:puromycin-sensitive aminopeptidase
MIPVCFKSSDGKPFCQILSQREEVVPLTGCSAWVFTNANAVGYYRTQYNGEAFQKLNASAMAQLGTAERMSLVDDEAALMRAGKESVANLLDLVATLNQDFEDEVVGSYIGSLIGTNNYLVASQDRPAFQSWIRSNFRPMMKKIGWMPSPGEASDVGELRLYLLGILAGIGEDPEAIRESSNLAEQYLKDPQSVNPDLARIAMTEAAHWGDAALFDRYLAAMREAKSPERFYTIVEAMSGFRDPQLVQRWLQISVSDATRNQDAAGQIAAELSRYDVQQIAWQWVKEHWPEVEKKTTMSSGASIVGATGSFCDAVSRDDAQQFFQQHKVSSSERALRLAMENVNACISFRDHQQKNLTAWLGQHAGSTAAATGNR